MYSSVGTNPNNLHYVLQLHAGTVYTGRASVGATLQVLESPLSLQGHTERPPAEKAVRLAVVSANSNLQQHRYVVVLRVGGLCFVTLMLYQFC